MGMGDEERIGVGVWIRDSRLHDSCRCPSFVCVERRIGHGGCIDSLEIVLMSDRCLMKNRSLPKRGRRGFSPLHPNSINFHGQLPTISLFHDLEQMGVGQQPFDLLRAGTLGGNQDLFGRVTVVNDYLANDRLSSKC